MNISYALVVYTFTILLIIIHTHFINSINELNVDPVNTGEVLTVNAIKIIQQTTASTEAAVNLIEKYHLKTCHNVSQSPCLSRDIISDKDYTL